MAKFEYASILEDAEKSIVLLVFIANTEEGYLAGEHIIDALNEMGENGWEHYAVAPYVSATGNMIWHRHYLKKELDE